MSEKEAIEQSLQCEQRSLQRQELLKRLWRLRHGEESTSHNPEEAVLASSEDTMQSSSLGNLVHPLSQNLRTYPRTKIT